MRTASSLSCDMLNFFSAVSPKTRGSTTHSGSKMVASSAHQPLQKSRLSYPSNFHRPATWRYRTDPSPLVQPSAGSSLPHSRPYPISPRASSPICCTLEIQFIFYDSPSPGNEGSFKCRLPFLSLHSKQSKGARARKKYSEQ